MSTEAARLAAQDLSRALARDAMHCSRNGVPHRAAGFMEVAAILANAGQSPPELDASPSNVDASVVPPVSVSYSGAAKALDVSVRTISRLVNAGRLRTVGSGRGRRVLIESIHQYAKEGS